MKTTIGAIAIFLITLNSNYSLATDLPPYTKSITPPRDALQENKKINCTATPNFSSSKIVESYTCEIVIGGVDGYKLYPENNVKDYEDCNKLCDALSNICTK